MHDLYVRIMGWIAGEALANSDRLKVTIGGFLAAIALKALSGCSVCASILTPDVVNQLSAGIAVAVVSLVASLTKRDVAAPGQVVEGAATDKPTE